MEIQDEVMAVCQRARAASHVLANLCADARNGAIEQMAGLLESESEYIMAANEQDMQSAREAGLPDDLRGQLRLDAARITAIANGLRHVAKLPDPMGKILEQRSRPSGIQITKIRTPIGVIGVVCETRMDIMVNAAALCLKTGNALVLCGGAHAASSTRAMAKVFQQALLGQKLTMDAVQCIESAELEALAVLVGDGKLVDAVIPRGSHTFVRGIAAQSRVPVIGQAEGACHTYIGKEADAKKAIAVAVNAKVQQPDACNAMTTLLVDKAVAKKVLPPLLATYRAAGVELRGCEDVRAIDAGIAPAADPAKPMPTGLALTVRIMDGLEDAIAFINAHGAHLADAIVTENHRDAVHFLHCVDSAAVYVNASTRFTDGGEFGMGTDIGMSTDKLPARGPIGLEELTSYKYMIRGEGAVRQ